MQDHRSLYGINYTRKEEEAVMKTTSLPLIFAGIVSALLVWSTFIPSDAVAGAAMEQMIENAKTKEDHETIAKHFAEESEH